MARTSQYRRLRRTGGLRLRWHLARRLPRIDPAWPWWALWIGGATAAAAALDALDVAPWWVGPPAGLALGTGAVALSALDDVRRPIASLAVVGAELRSTRLLAPDRVDAVRAERFDIPLYAPPGAEARIDSGGITYDGGLYSPARPSIGARWTGPERAARAMTVRTTDEPGRRWLHDGWRGTVTTDDPAAPVDDGWPGLDAIEAACTDLEVDLDGVLRTGRGVDLRRWGGGWAATVRADGRHRVELSGDGPLPEQLVLTRRAPATLVRRDR